ncbi:MAG: retroviral-like aspartic protease family protein [Candidatus Rokubacteria bacterium]|nr:retroviral-like aspartic protease family protein [Candidatus Rokubacteria bacterium]
MGGARRLPRSALAALVLMLTLAPGAHAQLYRWTDEKGETHFGQGVDSIPERYRSRASAVGRVDPPPAPSGPAAATVTDGVTRIRFAPGLPIMVTAKINGRAPVQLVLDTGATRTTISPTALIGLGVTYRDAPKVQIRGVTGSASAYLVSLESVEVGGARVGPLRVFSHDAQLGRGAEGLLGRDFLDHFRVTIDNARGVVELAPK